MYRKLSVRNVKRSFMDYLLYFVTVSILLAVMECFEFVAEAGRLAGFQTASLPLLIVMILIILIYYMNGYMLKQRAKEFASYLLMGMAKRKLTEMFLCEFGIMGAGCFLMGTVLGTAASGFIYLTGLWPGSGLGGNLPWMMVCSVFHSLLYFGLAQLICSYFTGRRLYKMRISDLLLEEKRNRSFQDMGTCRKWGLLFLIGLVCFLGGMLGVTGLPGQSGLPVLSVIAIPLFTAVFAGYRYLFACLCQARRQAEKTGAGFFYRKSRLYSMAWMLSNPQKNALLGVVFCICLLFSAVSFQFGVLLFVPGVPLYDKMNREWMGFLQICLSILFFTVCFSIQALLLLTEIRREAGNLKILYYLGKSRAQIKAVLQRQIALRLALPFGMAAPLLFLCTPLVNRKLRTLLPGMAANVLPGAAGTFGLCTAFFYLLYFAVVCKITAPPQFAKAEQL